MTDIKRIAARGIAGLCWLVMVCGGAWAQPSVWTHRYDNARSGVNAGEVQLNTSNVNPGQFGKLFSYGVDADIYTQPLVIANVAVAGKGTHNVVFVATNNNSVYAFDADTNRSGNDLPLWHVNFNGPGVTPIPATDVQTLNSIRTPGPIGIMGTPVIDQATGTLYVVARTKETVGASVTYVQRLHALDIRSGAEKFGGPVMITATVAGTGYDNAGGVVTFNARTANQRAGLALANGNVYIAWSSYGDGGFYHGWVMAYSASTLQQVGVFCITPDGSAAGVWQSGQPPSIDASGNLYLATGNGTFDGVRNFGQTILKLNPNLSTVLDWFTPGNWDSLNRSDRDLGSSGVLLVPGTNDVIGAGKDGLFYVLDRNNLGHSQSGNGQILQSFRVAIGNVHGGPTYWNGSAGPRVFVWGEDDYLKSFAVSGALLNTTPVSKSPYAAPPGMPGGFLTVSSNGTQAGSGVLWASLPYAEDANDEVVSGVLRAFDATDLSRELWNTRMVPARDDIGNFAKYVPPTVVNGRVYMSSFSNRLNVYGLLASIPAASGGSITGAGVLSSAAVDLTAVGTTDWAVWPQYEGKSTGNSRISDFGYLGASVGTFANAARRFTWNDGGLNLCSASASGVYAAGLNNGFLLTVPAGTTARTLRLYLGGNNSRGMLTARLSDGSAPQFVDTAFSSTGQYDVVYTLNFSAAASDEQLTVTWSQFSGAGNVTLQAAALSGPADPPSPTGCIWVDDATPLNATLTSSGGDSWTWVGSNPTPFSRGLAHQSAIAAGMHQHLFSNATTKMQVGTGDDLFAYVYLDPANPPTEVMLQWNDGSWEHRAYWGSNQLTAWGVDGTASRRYMGVLPPLGQWVKLSVPAASVGLEGRTLSGMAFTLFGGRATFDYAGKTSAGATTYQLSGTVTQGGSALNGVVIAATNGVTCSSSDAAGRYACTVPQGWSGTVTPSKAGYTFTPASRTYSAVGADRTTENYAAAASAQTVWVDDAVPGGAAVGGAVDGWTWIGSNPAPFAGALAHQSAATGGMHQHYFYGATATLPVAVGDTLFAYVYLDPANPPSEVMLQWNDGSWEHRAYWGTNQVSFGVDGTSSRRYMGALPATGQWVKLSVPAAVVGLEGRTLNGMAFTLYGGRATFDYAGKSAGTVWVDEAVPAGATRGTAGGDAWTWVTTNPTPFQGAQAHQSAIAAGMHQHFFEGATATLPVAVGDTLYAYVYLDPANPPSEVMLQWNDGSWEHRAYWGTNQLSFGADGTSSRRYMGALPATGTWVRLAVPASWVGLEGRTLNGMAFTLFGGRATWDYAGTTR